MMSFSKSILIRLNIGPIQLCTNLVASILNRNPVNLQQQRNVIYFTHSQGKFRSNKAVLRRFYRLNWGAWIRPRAGRHKHLWRKPYYLRWWAKQHVFCTDEQNKVLEQMVSARYKKPTYFVDDPYEPYQKRHNLVYVPLGKNRISRSYMQALLDK